tara:strand:+ start:514 stop:750 length:237 start_codon:yes stop_codon:yes gene_type:complete
MTDNDKLNMIQRYLIEYVQSWKTLPDTIQFLNNITKVKIKTALKNRIQADLDRSGELIINEQGKIDDQTSFYNEMDSL